jgi:hypothetical protein
MSYLEVDWKIFTAISEASSAAIGIQKAPVDNSNREDRIQLIQR